MVQTGVLEADAVRSGLVVGCVLLDRRRIPGKRSSGEWSAEPIATGSLLPVCSVILASAESLRVGAHV